MYSYVCNVHVINIQSTDRDLSAFGRKQKKKLLITKKLCKVGYFWDTHH